MVVVDTLLDLAMHTLECSRIFQHNVFDISLD